MASGRMKLSELGSFIRDQRRSARLSLRKLSDLAGISNPYLSQIERGLRKPSAEILQAIAKALRISAETLYVRAGILDADRRPDLVSEILKDESLSELQKQVLIDHYRSYVESNRPPHERAASIQEVTGESSRGLAKQSESSRGLAKQSESSRGLAKPSETQDLPTAEES